MIEANEVVSLVWLGHYDLWIRIGLLGGAAICAIFNLAICIHIIREVSREKKEEKCQSCQR